MNDATPKTSLRSRLAAVGALICFLGVLVAVVGFLFRNAGEVLIASAGVALLGAGGWWAVTQRMPRRAVGFVVIAAGLAVITSAIGRSIDGAERVGVQVAIVALLLAASLACARAALVHELHHIDVRVRPGGPPRQAVLLCNPWSGGGKVERFGLVDLAAELGVETVVLDHGLDLEQLARDAVERGADCLGMAGGDGSQALVAAIAIEHGLPFVCVSAGTRNHFALDLGLNRDDPRDSMYAFRDAVERRVDYATVNGRLFVNNVSLGVYAHIVQEQSYRDSKFTTTTTLLPELLGRQSEPFDLQFTAPNGAVVDGAILVMVSNNRYVVGTSVDNAQRRRLDTGELGVFAVTTSTGAAAARLFAASALGQRRRSDSWHEFTTTSFEVRSRSGTAFAGVDGEALELRTPLQFQIHPGGLTLLVPTENVEVAARRQARDVAVRDLLAIAVGAAPRGRS